MKIKSKNIIVYIFVLFFALLFNTFVNYDLNKSTFVKNVNAAPSPSTITAGTTGSISIPIYDSLTGFTHNGWACGGPGETCYVLVGGQPLYFVNNDDSVLTCTNGSYELYETVEFDATSLTSLSSSTTIQLNAYAIFQDQSGECYEVPGTQAETEITINPSTPPDFTITCSPATRTINAGSATSFNISTTGTNGFSSAVTVSHSFSPSSGTLPTISYNNNGAVPDSTTTANVSTTTGTTAATYTVTFSATGGGLTKTCNTTLTVNPYVAPPVGDIKCGEYSGKSLVYGNGPCTIPYNDIAEIQWTSTNATSCTVTPNGWTGTSGTQSESGMTSTKTYTLTCTNSAGSHIDTVDVIVGTAPAPVVDLKVNGSNGPVNGSYGAPVTVSWSSYYTTSCSVTSSPNVYSSSALNNAGSQSSNLTTTTTFSITCSGPGSPPNATDSVLVNIPAPTFNLSCSPATSSIIVGASTSFNLVLTAQNGFNSSVTVSHSFTPSSGTLPTVSYTNNPATPSATVTANISTTASTTPTSYSIYFNAVGGSVNKGCYVTLNVAPVSPPSDPINVSADNSGTCETIDLTWNKGSTGADPEFFRVYHKTSAGSSWVQIGSDIAYVGNSKYTYTHTSPAATSNYYAIRAFIGTSGSGYGEPAVTPISEIVCAPNLTTSDKDLIQVGNNTLGASDVDCNAASDIFSLPNDGVYSAGTTLKFRINVCNTGNQDLTGVTVTESPLNLTGLSLDATNSDACVLSFNGTAFTLSDITQGTTCSIVVNATVATPVGPLGSLYRFQNVATISSNEATFKVVTPPYLFSVGSGAPSRTETAPAN
ncbi:MAG: hypothetical protein R3B41_02435 [Candidatus Doudnabacteria bacterium]